MVQQKEIQRKKALAATDLQPVAEHANALAEKLGLDPYPVKYWIVDNDEMNGLIALGGFQNRYPHWRWGMAYDRQQKSNQFLGGKAFEIVNNDNPSHAFLQMSNSFVDQKAVITHVEAHADFFKNNQWFDEDPNAASMLESHARRISDIIQQNDVDREAVEKWIDNILCLEDNIDPSLGVDILPQVHERDGITLEDRIDDLGLSEAVERSIFDESWFEEQMGREDTELTAYKDLLGFLLLNGMQYDDDDEKAVEYEPWQRDIIEMLRRESYYFAPQKMTKIMNEGWAAFWESMMMGNENFAEDDEFVLYADHQSKVLNSQGFNPYKLGKAIWEYIENTTNRTEVVTRLLRIDGVTPKTFFDAVDFQTVYETLQPDACLDTISADTLDELDPDDPRVDAEALDAAQAGDIDIDAYPWYVLTTTGLAERNYSLTRVQNRGFIADISYAELDETYRYMADIDRYDSVEEALADVDYEAAWDRMRDVRAGHNDVTFLDEFLTDEFLLSGEYFAYEWNPSTDRFEISSRDPQDVKKKLLLQFTNFGKPTITVADANYQNRGELLLHHEFNGIMLDIPKVQNTMQRLYNLWGRPVALKTIVYNSDAEKEGHLLYYDGSGWDIESGEWEDFEHLCMDSVDYQTRPPEWFDG